jgi:hypothetical protein
MASCGRKIKLMLTVVFEFLFGLLSVALIRGSWAAGGVPDTAVIKNGIREMNASVSTIAS